MSRLGRYVGRARGSALRAVGAPNVPNLPSVRARVQRELRVPTSSLPGRRGSAGPDVPAGRRSGQPDHGVLSLVVGLLALALLVYLLNSPAVEPVQRGPAVTCHDKVVYEGTRLQDC